MLVSNCSFHSKFRKISALSLSIFLTIPPINLLEGFVMTQLLKLTGKIFLVSVGSVYLMSCTGGNVSSSFGSSNSGSLVDKIPDGMSSGVVDPLLFYVGVDNTVNDIAHVHLEGDFSKTCSIDPNTSLQDLRCIVDSPEAEIFLHGMDFIYNVPPGMCRYLRRQTYWFWNHEVGIGPRSIEINMTVTDGVVTASSCQFNGAGGFVACNSNNEALVDTSTQTPIITCVYDNTKLSGGQNGCLGKYDLTINTTTVITNPFSSTTSNSSSIVEWGGTVNTLVGGAGRHGWPLTKEGIPAIVYTPANLGLFNERYSIPKLIDVIEGSPIVGITTMEIANYSTPALNSHDGYLSGSVSTLPYALQPIDDFSGDKESDFLLGLPDSYQKEAYLYDCLDQAEEVLHRVRVYVREWDTYQDYFDYITSKGVTEVPDRAGNEGGACTGVAGPCNDYSDWDDLAAFWVSYTTNVPANTLDPAVGRRRNYFPQIPRK